MSDDSRTESKRRKLPQLVLRALIDGGKTIDEEVSSQNLRNIPVGAHDQIQHQSKSIWHSKPEIDAYVREKLDISDAEWNTSDSNRPSFWFTYVAQEISKLRKDGTITDWNPELRTGIWRLTHLKGIESSEPIVQINNSDIDSSNSNSKRFFIALGPWSNWEHTLNNPPFRWGVNPSSASNVGVFNALRHGDIVYYYANQDNPRQFSKRGLFGVGKVTRIYDEEHERYWPDEKLKDEVIYKHRFEIESLKLVKTDSELLPWIDGLPFTKGLNRVANEETLKQLIDNTEKIWNIHMKSDNIASEINSLIKDPETKLPILSTEDIDEGYDLISKELLIPKEKIVEIITALLSGRHILLAGPIGTGKTRLATLIPEIFWKKWGGYASEIYTATSDWSTLDVIGGILPKMENDSPKYVIQNGCVVSTVIKNSKIRTDHSKFTTIPYVGTWLVIDEFNRADIDKAFGQLFTALRTRNLKIPSNKIKEYDELEILKDYRIIGTLNTADKHFLFNLSDALKSRFAYIEIDIPTRDQYQTEIYYAMKNALNDLEMESSFDKIIFNDETKRIDEKKSDKYFYDIIREAYYVLESVRAFKKLGTAVLKLIYQNLIVGVLLSQNLKKSLDNSLISNLIPQLEHESSFVLGSLLAVHTNSVESFFKKAYQSMNRQSYLESFGKVLDYLEISGSEDLVSDFENGAIANDSSDWSLIEHNSAYVSINTGVLEGWTEALDDLKKSLIL